MSEASVSYRYFLPAPELRAIITTYYVLEIGGRGLIEELLFPEWANAGSCSTGLEPDLRRRPHPELLPPTALMSGVISRTAKIRGGPGRAVGVGFLPAGWGIHISAGARLRR